MSAEMILFVIYCLIMSAKIWVLCVAPMAGFKLRVRNAACTVWNDLQGVTCDNGCRRDVVRLDLDISLLK